MRLLRAMSDVLLLLLLSEIVNFSRSKVVSKLVIVLKWGGHVIAALFVYVLKKKRSLTMIL